MAQLGGRAALSHMLDADLPEEPNAYSLHCNCLSHKEHMKYSLSKTCVNLFIRISLESIPGTRSQWRSKRPDAILKGLTFSKYLQIQIRLLENYGLIVVCLVAYC